MGCELCKGKGYTRNLVDGYDTISPCACAMKKRLTGYFQKAGIPTRYWDWTLQSEASSAKNFFEIPFEYKSWVLSSPTDDCRKPFKPWSGPKKGTRETFHSQFSALKYCRELLKRYMDAFLEGKEPGDVPGLLMMGTVGIGKTHLLCALLGDLIYAGIKNVFFIEMTDLMKKLQFSYNQSAILKEEEILEPLISSDILVLDDLGSFTSDNYTWILNILGFILNKRYSFNKPTLITTNYFDDPKKGEKSLTDCLGTRLRSRIRETCPELIMKGYDFREFGKKTNEQVLSDFNKAPSDFSKNLT